MTTDATQAVMFHGRVPEDRDPGAEVMRTWRAVSLAVAGMRPRLPPVEYAVLLAVHGLVVSWTRLWDEVYVADVAIVAGVTTGDGQPDAKECGRRLRSLAQRGLIVYQPSKVKGRPSRVGMPAVTAAGTLVGGGQVTPPKPASNPAPSDGVRGGQAAPPNEENRGGQVTPLYTGGGREVPPPSEPPPTQAAIMVAVSGGGESPDTDQETPESPADDDRKSAVVALDVVATALPLGSRDRTLLTDAVLGALAAGWEPEVLGAHLTADVPGPIRRPLGFLTYRLGAEVLPEGPTACACTACCRHIARVKAEIRRQATAAEQAQRRHAATNPDDTAARNEQITSSLGPALHGRILAAADQAEYAARLAATAPNAPRPTPLAMRPGRARGLAAEVYAAHGHDMGRIRAYAEALPPGPAESAQDDTTTPTPAGHGPARLRRVEGA